MSRNKTKKAVNRNQQYKDVFESRGVEKIEQFRTPVLKPVPDSISTFDYVWKNGDKFWLLAHKIFGDRKLWYIIAQLNNKPTESHVEVGETIKIPYDINEALQEIKK